MTDMPFALYAPDLYQVRSLVSNQAWDGEVHP